MQGTPLPSQTECMCMHVLITYALHFLPIQDRVMDYLRYDSSYARECEFHTIITNQCDKNLIWCAKVSENMNCYLIQIQNFPRSGSFTQITRQTFPRIWDQIWSESLSFSITFGWSFSHRCTLIGSVLLVAPLPPPPPPPPPTMGQLSPWPRFSLIIDMTCLFYTSYAY